ncbi:hypothetical protein [Mycolicibacterium sp. 624]|uniref:hypothetical protein n=1 Tax=Mycolicibacterium sp. 624 TaxID=3156314 RepID=UPI003394B4A8
MQLALRPYVTAGVALVAAGAIAATPVLAPAPEIQSRIESHAVVLTAAIDNPINVFRPVVDKVGALVQGAIQAELDNPFPIINGLIGRAVIDANALGEIANTMGQIVTTLATKFPAALGTAAYRAFHGDFTGAVGAFAPVFMGPFFQTFGQFMKLQTFVQDRFVLAGKLAGALMMSAWALGPGQALGLFSLMNAAAGGLDELWKAVPSGDLGRIVNAIQHGVANVTIAALNMVDSWRWSLDYERTRIRDILNPPPPAPEELVTSADVANVETLALPAAAVSLTMPAPESSTSATEEVVAPASSTPVAEEVVAPVEVPATEVVVTPVEVPATDETELDPQVRPSPIAVPGVTGTTTETSNPRNALNNSVRDAVKKVTDGIKNVTAGLGGKKKSETSSGSTGSSSESGSNDHDGE